MRASAGTGFSEHADSHTAGAEATRAALDQAGTGRVDLVLLFGTSKHDPERLRDGVRSVVGAEPVLFGGAAPGVLTNERLGYGGSQVGVAVVASDEIAAEVFVERALAGREYEAGRALGGRIAARGYEAPPSLFLLHARGSAGEPEPTDLHTLLDETVALVQSGRGTPVEVERAYDAAVGEVAVVRQAVGRAVLNLLDNAFHAVRARRGGRGGLHAARDGADGGRGRGRPPRRRRQRVRLPGAAARADLSSPSSRRSRRGQAPASASPSSTTSCGATAAPSPWRARRAAAPRSP